MPENIPVAPYKTYKKIGQAGEITSSIAPSNRSFRPFQEEKEFVQSLKHFPVK